MSELLATTTIILGLSLVFIGLTAQIIKNYNEKRCGNSLILISLAILLYISRTCYAISTDSVSDFLPIIIPDIFGIMASGINLGQHFYYKKHYQLK